MNQAFDIRSIKGLTQDSRRVEKGYLFAALPGLTFNGIDYIDEAIGNGAIAILAPEDFAQVSGKAQFIKDKNPRRRFALMAAEFYERQPGTIVAVTGTNGKTSTVHFARQLWESLNYKAASMGTLGVEGLGLAPVPAKTTPDPVTLHHTLDTLAKDGFTHLAMEASSHGLDQYRMDGVRIRAAGFTNLTQDHLDYHSNMDSYFDAKLRLFDEVMNSEAIAVLNADIPAFKVIKTITDRRKIKILSYGYNGEDLRIMDLQPLPHGQKVTIQIFGKTYKILFPLPGAFQVMNALCALGLVLAEDAQPAEQLVQALQNLQGVPGRLQPVPGHPEKAGIYIDYAHTPDALETVLKALRPHTKRKLVCVFGCGGDRDKTKRPLMGQIAAALADRIIVTDDNPRSENPASIRQDILRGAPHAENIGDRAEAIRAAITSLQSGDVLIIAGKGHEQGQIFNERVEPFDDFKQATKTLEELHS